MRWDGSSAKDPSGRSNPPPRSPWRIVALVTALFLVGGAAGFFLAWSYDQRIVRGVAVGDIPLGGLDRRQARERLQARGLAWSRQPVTLAYAGETWTITPAEAGLALDYDRTLEKAGQIGRRGSILRQISERRRTARQGESVAPEFRLDSRAWRAACGRIEAVVNREPVNAHLSVDRAGKLTITPGRSGVRLDRQRLLAILESGYIRGKAICNELPAITCRPELSNEDITEWPLDQVLGVYTTKFTAADVSRTHNLSMAAAALDGLIVKAGDEFSFNKNVGPRAPEQGYMEAPVILKNKLVLGVGGGVCQVSSTLFNAVLLANLPIRKRSTHSLPSSYVPLGRDATVVYDALDFVFANDTQRPVVIATQVTGSYLTVGLVGHREVSPAVKIETEIKEKTPFKMVVENDPGLAAGVEVVAQEGKNGYKIVLWRTSAWPDGRISREQIGISTYPAIDKIVKHGVGSPRFGNWTLPAPASPKPAGPPPALAGGNP